MQALQALATAFPQPASKVKQRLQRAQGPHLIAHRQLQVGHRIYIAACWLQRDPFVLHRARVLLCKSCSNATGDAVVFGVGACVLIPWLTCCDSRAAIRLCHARVIVLRLRRRLYTTQLVAKMSRVLALRLGTHIREKLGQRPPRRLW